MTSGPVRLPTGAVVRFASPGPPKVIVVPKQGPPGPPGGGTISRIAAVALGGHRLVVPRDDGQVIYADASVLAHASRPIWFTTAAWAAGQPATLTAAGLVSEGSWSWAPGDPIYLGLDGLPTHTVPPTAVFVRQVAQVVSPTTIQVDVSAPIILT